MTLSEHTVEELTDLLRRLIEAYTDFPRDLTLTPRILKGRVDWSIEANINDQGKIVGKQGSHINALKFIFALIGQRHGQQFVLNLRDGSGEREPEILRRPAPPTYSCSTHRQLLSDVLAAVFEDGLPVIARREGQIAGKPVFVLEIGVERRQDFEVLVNDSGPALLDALATLFSAAASRDGVAYRVEAV